MIDDSRDPDRQDHASNDNPVQEALDQARRSADVSHADAAKLHREAGERLARQGEHQRAAAHLRAAEVHEAAAHRRPD